MKCVLSFATNLLVFLSITLLPCYAAHSAEGDKCEPGFKVTTPAAQATRNRQQETPPRSSQRESRAEFRVIPSERVAGDAVQYTEYVAELTAPNGVLDNLGIQMTGQVVEFLQPRDLNALTSGTAGGYPVSHYLDGAAVVGSLSPARTGYALEVVYPGPRYQHGFYRDDNPAREQFSIIDHVVGHNHFAFTSGLAHYRYDQGLEATRDLDRILTDAYTGFDKDQVQRFYLWSLTLGQMWDWYAPLLEQPAAFSPTLRIQDRSPTGRARNQIRRNPGRVTENILTAFMANLAPNQPEWKRAILEKLMSGMSFRPALVHTQIMNEGWASIMQEIIPKHTTTHHDFNFWFGASRVMQTEEVPNLRDPYSLGVACWRRIRERFFSSPEGRALITPIEKDRAFIEHASHIIATMTDEEFLRFAMDQTFVDRFNFSVVKKLPQGLWDHNLPPPQNREQNWQWQIVSKDADRVVQMVIDRVLKPKYYFNPRVRLLDFNRPGSGEIELVLDDQSGVAFPLDQQELGPALYAMANTMDKPVSLLCTLVKEVPTGDSEWIWDPLWGPKPAWAREPTRPVIFRARVVVAPNGDLQVFRITDSRANTEISALPPDQRALSEEPDVEITQVLNEHLAAYIEDLYLEDDAELDRVYENSPGLRKAVQAAVTSIVDSHPYDGLVSHSPNSAGAMLEYKLMLERRLYKALERAIKKKGGLVSGQNGVRVRALPSVVNIGFDRNYIEKLKDELSTSDDVSPMLLNRSYEIASGERGSPFNPDEGGRGGVGPIRGEEGDRFWGPGDNQGGQSGTDPGEDPNDLSWVEIPQNLYEQFLAERIKLPVLNRKPGQSRTMATRQGGRIRRKQGIMLPDEILANALKRGVGASVNEGILDPFDDLSSTLDIGFENLQPRDIVVKHRRPTKRPDIRAAVVFVMDASGSTANYTEAFKRFVHDVESLVRANYKGFDFRYIVFDTEAHVLRNKNDFFRSQLGGGTMYSTGIGRVGKLFEDEYPRAQWDRYTFLLGDMDDMNPEQAFQDIKALLDQSEYFGTVAGLNHSFGARLDQDIKAESAINESLGYTLIDPDGGYSIRNIKEVLKNDPN